MSAKFDLDYSGEANGPAALGSLDDTVNRNTAMLLGRLTNVAGTNSITGRLSMSAGFAGISTNARFSFVPANDNTGAVTMQLQTTAGSNVGSAFALKTVDGDALASGDLVAGRLYEFEYNSGEGYARLVTMTAETTGAVYDVFTSSGTWNKPGNVTANSRVLIQVWAGGGGGYSGSGGGGGGGGFKELWMLASDLGSTETVTIGSGGAVDTAGGNSSFGSHVTAYGGGTGSTGGGGGGGGATAKGSDASGGTGGAGGAPLFAYVGGGNGGGTGVAGGSSSRGGGGGGGSAAAGGPSEFAGGGGGGNAGAAGTSIYGGAGGGSGAAGTAPGGGGGAAAAGARGEVRVTVFI